MKLPDYVPVKEVAEVCRKLKIRNWTELKKAEVTTQEAEAILAELETGDMKISVENFRIGLEVELEHGIRFPEANVTNNHPILTGKIVLAHFKETLDYYQRLRSSRNRRGPIESPCQQKLSESRCLLRKTLESKTPTKPSRNRNALARQLQLYLLYEFCLRAGRAI